MFGITKFRNILSFQLPFKSKIYACSKLTPWSRVLLEKLSIAQLIIHSPLCIQPEVSLPCSRQSATGPYPELHAYSPHPLTLFPKIHSSILYLCLGLQSSFSLHVFRPIIFYAVICPVHATCHVSLIVLDGRSEVTFDEAPQ